VKLHTFYPVPVTHLNESHTIRHFTKVIIIDEIGICKGSLNYDFHSFTLLTMTWYLNFAVEWYWKLFFDTYRLAKPLVHIKYTSFKAFKYNKMWKCKMQNAHGRNATSVTMKEIVLLKGLYLLVQHNHTNYTKRGVFSRMVKVVDFNHLPLTAVGSSILRVSIFCHARKLSS
jgi:hypothetical protein